MSSIYFKLEGIYKKVISSPLIQFIWDGFPLVESIKWTSQILSRAIKSF